MKKLSFIILLIALSLSAKSQSYSVSLNGYSEWPGYGVACPNSTYHAIVTLTGANSTFSYLWMNSSYDTICTSANCNLPLGDYIFQIKINGVVDNEQNMLIVEEDEMVITPDASNVSTYDGHDGSISLLVQGGSTPYSYLWSNSETVEDIDSIVAGTYTVTVTSYQGCTQTNSITLTQPSGPLRIDTIYSPNYNNFNISEKGKADGKINLVVAGGTAPYTYKWFPFGNPTSNPDTLPAREFTVVVTDSNNATVTRKITLTEPNRLGLTLTKYESNCHGCNNGSIKANASGGVQPYTYLWSSGQTTDSIYNLPSRDYSVVVIDINGAKIKEGVYLMEPDANDWSLSGNANIQSNQFIGTTDSIDLVYKTNNTERMRIHGNGNIKFNSLAGTGLKLLSADNNGNVLRFNGLGYLPASGNNPELFSIGHDPIIINTNPLCPNAPPPSGLVDWQLNGHLQCIQVAQGGTPTAALQMWFDGQNGNIDMSGSNTSPAPDPKLHLNWFCEADVIIGHQLANLYANNKLFVADRLGVGTVQPSQKFEVAHNDAAGIAGGMAITNVSGSNWNSEIKFKKYNDDLWSMGCDVTHNSQHNFFIYDNWTGNLRFLIDGNGRVGIGTTPNPNGIYKLYVEDGIATREVKVTVQSFPDYVFQNDYDLISIYELKKFIKENNHLPGIPSAAEVKEDNGFEVGAMQIKLLEKLEEQTLYIIKLQEQIDELKNKLFKK